MRDEGFQNTDLREIQELTDIKPEELKEDNLMEISASKLEPDDEEENTRKSCARKQTDNRRSDRKKGSNYSRLFLTSFYVRDPSMAQALKMKQTVEKRLETFSEK